MLDDGLSGREIALAIDTRQLNQRDVVAILTTDILLLALLST
jgi:hypothetical protein